MELNVRYDMMIKSTNDYPISASYKYSQSQPPSAMNTAKSPPQKYSPYPYAASYSQAAVMTSAYPQSSGYGSTCPPGCTCGYNVPIQDMTNQQPQQYQGFQYAGYNTSMAASSASSSDIEQSSVQYDKVYYEQKPDPQQTPPSEVPPAAEESGKYPFSTIIQAIARGLVGESYAANINEDDFRIKLEPTDSQRLSGLMFFKSFTQRDLNLQCTLILQVLAYWSQDETMPESQQVEDQRSSSSRRDRRRDSGGNSRRKNRGPPIPRYWTRMENAAVIGLMLGVPFEFLKVVLEGTNTADLREVDAILDTNSAEVCPKSRPPKFIWNTNLQFDQALELMRTGQMPSRGRYSRNGPDPSRQPISQTSSPLVGANIWSA